MLKQLAKRLAFLKPAAEKPARDRQLALVRRQAAALKAKYDAAQTSREGQNHWQWADGLSAAAANSPEVRRTLRMRSRYEVANNTYASGMVDTLATHTIGTGPSLQMLSGDDAADSAVEMAFWNWMQAAQIPEKLYESRFSRCVDGEVFALFTNNDQLADPVQLDLRTYEADQVANPWMGLSAPNNESLLSDGIFYDRFGNPTGYTLLSSHPGDTGFTDGGIEYTVVPARDVIHLFRSKRPGQLRGIPEIMSALPLYAQLRRYTLAVVAAAETAADLAALLHTQSAVEDPDDIEPLDVFDLERRSIMTLPRGWTAQQMKAEQPTTTYAMFKREIINEIARCLGMPYNIAAGDSSGYNYASGRLDHQTYFKSLRVDRDYIERAALERIFARWWQEARLIPSYLPPIFDDWIGPPPHQWFWDGFEHVDPLKEANAQGIRLANNTSTLARECQMMGLDWQDVLRQRAREEQFARELGLVTQQSAQQATVQEDDDAEE